MDDPRKNQKWVELGNRARKAAAVWSKFHALAHPVDVTTRRSRLAKLLATARSGFAAARSAPKMRYSPGSAYDRAARALAVYHRKRYQPVVQAKRTLHPGGLVYDPSMRLVKTKYGYDSQTTRRTPWHVQPADKPRPHLQPSPSPHPAVAVQRFMAKRLGRQHDAAMRQLGVLHPGDREQFVQKRLKRAGFDFKPPPTPKDRSQLPHWATYDPRFARVPKPIIRRARIYQNLGAHGVHPANWLLKRPLGRREVSAARNFMRGGDA